MTDRNTPMRKEATTAELRAQSDNAPVGTPEYYNLNDELLDRLETMESALTNHKSIGRIKVTDLKMFINFYKQVGVDMKPSETKENGNLIFCLGGIFSKSHVMSEIFTGHEGFFTSVEFTPEGKFVQQGFWE